MYTWCAVDSWGRKTAGGSEENSFDNMFLLFSRANSDLLFEVS